ncbi:MAG: multidrug effflux MFS transporter [Muribaculaceae bacterium]|nr:multidrug effflux MFS transporter [Muribaculaceae bacterium]
MTSPAPTTSSPQPRHYVEFLIYIAILGAFSSLVNDMYLPTMPAMMREFHTTPSATQLGLSMAMLGMGIGSLVWGSLSDSRGRKSMLIWSLVIFVIATGLSLLSRSIGFFVGCRLIQGLGAGGAMVLSYSIPTDYYSGRNLAAVMALVGAINGIAPAGSPLLGGFMAESVGWRGIFIVLLAIGVVMTFWSCRMPDSLPPSRRSAAKSLRQYAQAYMVMFKDRRFMTYVLLKAIGIGVLYAYISSAPFILQDHFGFRPLEFGLIFGGNAIAIALGSMLVMRFRVLKTGLVAGSLIMCAFGIGDAAVMYFADSFLLYELMSVPMLLGSGMIFASANSLGMDVGRSDAGTAAAILNVIKYIFAAIVAPLVGLGNILHSTAITFTALCLITLALAYAASRLTPLQEMIKTSSSK